MNVTGALLALAAFAAVALLAWAIAPRKNDTTRNDGP